MTDLDPTQHVDREETVGGDERPPTHSFTEDQDANEQQRTLEGANGGQNSNLLKSSLVDGENSTEKPGFQLR